MYRIILLLMLIPLLTPGCNREPDELTAADVSAPKLELQPLLKSSCSHLAQRRFQPITAADEPANAPFITVGGDTYEVSLVATEEGNGGVLAYEAPAVGELVVLMNQPIPLLVTDERGTMAALEQELSAPQECSHVKLASVFHLPSPGPFFLELGPTGESRIHLQIKIITD